MRTIHIKTTIAVVGFLTGTFSLWGQGSVANDTGKISGRIIDQSSGQAVREASIAILEDASFFTRSSIDGTFLFSEVPAGLYTVRVFKAGYPPVDVKGTSVEAGKTVDLDVLLEPTRATTQQPATEAPSADPGIYELQALEVNAEEIASADGILIYARRRSFAVMDSVGEEAFSNLGISDAAQALSKVVGATIVDGKYAVIRGLGDRYTNTRLNNLSVPSSDPDRLAVQLDQFPSDLLESVVTTKTFTPDQPGSFSGGSINMRTKSIPNGFFTKLSVGVEYNDQVTGENVFSIPGGGRDWLGRDDGTRDVLRHIPAQMDSAQYVNLIYRTTGNLEPALELDRIVRIFDDRSYFPTRKKASPDIDGSISFGDRIDFRNKQTIGYIVSFTYDKGTSHYDKGTTGKYSQGKTDPNDPDFFDLDRVFSPDVTLYNFYEQYLLTPETTMGFPQFGVTRTSENVDWGAFAQIAWRPSSLHEIAFRFFHNQSAEDSIKRGVGEAVRSDTGQEFREAYDLLYTERAVRSFQLSGEHALRFLNDATLDWRLARSKSTQEQPDYRTFEFKWHYVFQRFDNTGLPPRYRVFRNLEDDMDEAAVDLTLPISLFGTKNLKIKTGALYSEGNRTNFEDIFKVEGFRSENAQTIPTFPGSPGIREITPTSVTFNTWYQRESSNGRYIAEQETEAGYLMLDYEFLKDWRLVGGVRYENTYILTTPQPSANVSVQEGLIDQSDWLPAASLIYSIQENMNLRLAYGKTFAKPTYRELADISINDRFTDTVWQGNPNLKMTGIESYDFRWEWFPRENDVVAVSVFYKELKNPIEITFDGQFGAYRPDNVSQGEVLGVEFEYRQNLSWIGEWASLFTVGFNYTWIESKVDIPPGELNTIRTVFPDAEPTRELFGQSPYIFNLDLTYSNPDWGTVATVVYNVYGERLDLVVTGAQPDVYEQPAPSLDFIFRQRLSDRWQLKLSIKNLLNPDYEKKSTYRGTDYVYESFSRGRSLGVSLSYSFN